MIETVCKNCGNLRVFEDSYAGRRFKCPVCGKIVVIKSLETDEIAEKDKISRDSVDVIVNKKKKELEKEKQKLIEKQKELEKSLEEANDMVDKKLIEYKEEDMKKYLDDRKICRISGWTFYILLVLCIIFGWFIDIKNETILYIICFAEIISGIIYFPALSSYNGFKRKFFGNNKDLVFTEEYEKAARDRIAYYFWECDMRELRKGYRIDMNELYDKIYNIDVSIDKIEHPELYMNSDEEKKDE